MPKYRVSVVVREFVYGYVGVTANTMSEARECAENMVDSVADLDSTCDPEIEIDVIEVQEAEDGD